MLLCGGSAPLPLSSAMVSDVLQGNLPVVDPPHPLQLSVRRFSQLIAKPVTSLLN